MSVNEIVSAMRNALSLRFTVLEQGELGQRCIPIHRQESDNSQSLIIVTYWREHPRMAQQSPKVPVWGKRKEVLSPHRKFFFLLLRSPIRSSEYLKQQQHLDFNSWDTKNRAEGKDHSAEQEQKSAKMWNFLRQCERLHDTAISKPAEKVFEKRAFSLRFSSSFAAHPIGNQQRTRERKKKTNQQSRNFKKNKNLKNFPYRQKVSFAVRHHLLPHEAPQKGRRKRVRRCDPLNQTAVQEAARFQGRLCHSHPRRGAAEVPNWRLLGSSSPAQPPESLAAAEPSRVTPLTTAGLQGGGHLAIFPRRNPSHGLALILAVPRRPAP